MEGKCNSIHVRDKSHTHFIIPPRNIITECLKSIHTCSRGLVLVAQSGLWWDYQLYTANKISLKVSSSLLLSKSNTSHRDDWYAEANNWLLSYQSWIMCESVLEEQGYKNPACIQMIQGCKPIPWEMTHTVWWIFSTCPQTGVGLLQRSSEERVI